MTTQTMRRQVDRLKIEVDAIKPKPVTGNTVLMEPQRDASPEVVAEYLEKLAQARQNGNNIIVVRLTSPGRPEREDIAGVRYVEKEWQAQLAILTNKYKSNAEFIKSISGNVLGVAKDTVDEIPRRRA